MSGVTGAERIKSRTDFDRFVDSYKQNINKYPGFCSMNVSGSYNSDILKQDFGDIDLVVHIDTTKTKPVLKKNLQEFFHQQPESVIVPFTSPKYSGRRSYNSGEIVTVRYHDCIAGYSVQIDNIIALSGIEADFKRQFLDFPATKQGLILGLTKISAIETLPEMLFALLNIDISNLDPEGIAQNQEYEFNLSSNELQLRKITYDPGTFKQSSRTVVWKTYDMQNLFILLYQYDLSGDFHNLLAQSAKLIYNPRSYMRMAGIFTSMVSVKSGEVGTNKGRTKLG